MNALTTTLPALRVHLEEFANSCIDLLWPVDPDGGAHAEAPSHRLAPLEMQWIDAVPGLRVTCLDGCVALVGQGRPRDVILVRGECYVCQAAGRIALHAFVATEVLIG